MNSNLVLGRCYALFPLVVCHVALHLIQSGLFNWGLAPARLFFAPSEIILGPSIVCLMHSKPHPEASRYYR